MRRSRTCWPRWRGCVNAMPGFARSPASARFWPRLCWPTCRNWERFRPRFAAALVGVAPYARQSGTCERNGRCAGGRKHLRDIAYMAVLSAVKVKDPVLAGFYQGLRARGKPFKLAMVATMRKLITILNAIARSDPAFA
ncbi:transposase [Shinella kummerowiae]|uniref:transposase n=1 Tax=Shinella kummerowiae TaxID=417745 RepID=UPI003B847A25